LLKIAVIAYSCQPDKGSEPGIAWDFITEMANRGHKISVFTKSDKINFIANTGLANKVKFYFVKSSNFPYKSRLSAARIIHYCLWNISCFFYFKKSFSPNDFDLVHHVTFVNDWTPSVGAFLGIPFVLGPIGRHPKLPMRYLREQGTSILLRETLRNLCRKVVGLMDPLTHFTQKNATTIFVINESLVKPKFKKKTYVLPAVAIQSLNLKLQSATKKSDKIFRLYWAGNFLYWKGPRLAISAYLEAKKILGTAIELHMFGTGSEFKMIEAENKLEEGLFFHGVLPQPEFIEKARSMDMFLYPSFEGGGLVVLEALMAGKPVLGINYGGLSQMVTNDCGKLVEFTDSGSTACELSNTIIKIVRDIGLYRSLSKGAKERAVFFSIQRKCKVIEEIAY